MSRRTTGWVDAVAPATCVTIGAYLAAWAWRWPHSDMRNVWATVVGAALLVVGGVSLVAIRRLPVWPRRLGTLLTAALGLLGLWVLAVVSEDQRRICGDVLRQCRSLLPGP